MEILNIILTAVIALSGLPLGFLLAKIAKAELKSGKKYFQWMQNIIVISAIVLIFDSLEMNMIAFVIASIILSVVVIKVNPRATISYIILYFLLLVNIKNINMFTAVSALIFIYGFPTAALIMQKGLINYMKEELEKPIDPKLRKRLIRRIIHTAWAMMLELISIPALFMAKKNSAAYHLRFVCPICPSSRKIHRDVDGDSTCWWEYNWRRKNYKIPKHFGVINWIRQYTHFGTNLKKFKNIK